MTFEKKSVWIKLTLLMIDLLSIYSALLFSLLIRTQTFAVLALEQTWMIFLHFSIIYLILFLLLFLLGFYDIPPIPKPASLFHNLLTFFFLANSTGIIYFYLNFSLLISPKTILLLDISFFCILLMTSRLILYSVLKKIKNKIVCIGLCEEIVELMNNYLPQNGYEISAITSFSKDEANEKIRTALKENNVPLVATIPELWDIAYKNNIKIAVLISKIYQDITPQIQPISFNHFYEQLTKKISLNLVDALWILDNIPIHGNKLADLIKRITDISLSIVGCILCIILFPIISVIIKVDSTGTIFYTQKRMGKNGKIFIIYKFRTMLQNAELKGPQWASPNDNRMTRTGRVLRRLHLDELPQFFNVLKGQLSMVGPRPERPEFVKELKNKIPFYSIRHIVKPGLTGWAQISYQATNTIEQVEKKLQYDLYYLKNKSFILDFSIIIKTLRNFLP